MALNIESTGNPQDGVADEITFSSGDLLLVYPAVTKAGSVTLSTYGKGYNGALTLTVEEVGELSEYLLGLSQNVKG